MTSDTLELREITSDTVRAVTALAVAPEQEGYVSPNAVSIAEAYFEPKAWFRALACGDELVGFAMVYRDPEANEFHIWRFMVDAAHQGRGHGRRAAELLLEEARRDGIAEVTLNVRPGEHSALEFWQKLGFEDTGVVEYGQMRLRLSLAEPA
jgi:diamine N-acetyltransferase